MTYRALFWEAAAPDGDRFCARRVHVVELSNPEVAGQAAPGTPLRISMRDEGVQYGLAWPETATEERCAEVRAFIGFRHRRAGEPQLAVLSRLTDAMAAASEDGVLPFELECTGEDPAACEEPRQALATLPLDALLNVRLRNDQYRVVDSGPGLRVRQVQPVTDGRWPLADVEFDASGSNHKSWTVTLEGVDWLERVRMRRTTIIRH